ncbi:putative uncharacterized protein DDB_G0277255 [Panonychus citri]|uniref:putative uncharacterized protein DDB_G0277255 n=1 Tax=Panonychus citri TaxID=50023 RepID=UPI0023070F75|nr:putative uncharacterized protein DDB_G0277255 [Panonychus citri]
MEHEKSFLKFKSFNLLYLTLQLWILMVWTDLLILGKPANDNLLIGQKGVSLLSSSSSASRRFGPQFWGQSEKHIQLCEHICSNGPNEGQKYCNCSPEPSITINNEDNQNKQQLLQPQQDQQQQSYQTPYQQLHLQVNQHSSSEQKKTIQIPGVNYLGAHEATQICDYLCSENTNEAVKYCDCQNHNNITPVNNNAHIDNQINVNNLGNFANPPVNQVMASSEQVTSEQQQNYHQQQPQITLADYLRLDPSAERQLCSYLCSEKLKLENNEYCNCKTKKVNQQPGKIMNNNQHSMKSQLISELGKPNLSSNPLAIKNILDAAVDSNHRKELCSYVCALEPNEASNNQCNCNQNINNQKESSKSPRTRFHLNPWRSIKKWFG